MNRYLVKIMPAMSYTLVLWLTLCMGACFAAQTKQAGGNRPNEISQTDQTDAKSELKAGTQAYRAGKFAAAQQHFEKSLELDPTQKNVPFLIARAIQAQYRPGVETPENIAKAREAIDAYQKVLAKNPDQDEAYNAVASLYGAIKEDDEQRAWIMKRASLETLTKEKRSEAYTVLAAKDWSCAHKITEQPDNRQTAMKGNQAVVHFKKPKEQKDFDTAKQCATRGLELVEKAISLNPENESAWSHKHNLLREMAKLAGMEGSASQQSIYTKQADAARDRMTELSEKNRKKMEAVKSY